MEKNTKNDTKVLISFAWKKLLEIIKKSMSKPIGKWAKDRYKYQEKHNCPINV